MEITDLSWNENLSKRFNNPLLPRSIRGLIGGKSGCGKTTLLLNLLLKPGWLDYDTLFVFGKSLFQPEYTKWQQCFTNKLLTIKPNFNDKYDFYCKRKDQVILTRCRIGHSKFSHVHLLNNERAPQCINCNEPLTVKHILLNCTNFDRIRSNHFNVDNLQKLFFLY